MMKILDNAAKKEILYYLPTGQDAEMLSRFFSAFADSTRLRVLSALAIKKLCVSDLAEVINLNQTTVSHQLKILKSEGIVKCDRQGKVIFYSLADTKINQVLLFGVEFCG
jgi:DNA-binding transcriptional ArsR family regulator